LPLKIVLTTRRPINSGCGMNSLATLTCGESDFPSNHLRATDPRNGQHPLSLIAFIDAFIADHDHAKTPRMDKIRSPPKAP
jgi:hypothetical protein